MRSLLFNIYFYAVTTAYVLICVVLAILPGRKLMMVALSHYTKLIRAGMGVIAGIKVSVLGQDNIPDGLCILAAKHLSYSDGHIIFSEIKDLSFVTGKDIEKFPFVKQILRKLNAVVIDSCGGSDVRQEMSAQSAIVREQGRKILIFPEGHLSQIGTHHRYRKGVWHLYHDFKCPVIPVASNLGQRWNQQDWQKFPGRATVEFLEPIPPGLEKDTFMALLQDKIETRSIALLDLENLGALNPEDIGKERENHVARAKRRAREVEGS